MEDNQPRIMSIIHGELLELNVVSNTPFQQGVSLFAQLISVTEIGSFKRWKQKAGIPEKQRKKKGKKKNKKYQPQYLSMIALNQVSCRSCVAVHLSSGQ